jgi:hypothetical protein
LEKSGYDCLGQIVQRGLLQAKHHISTPDQTVVDNHLNSILATSIDGAVVIQRRCDNNIVIYPAQICVIECKTLTTEESLQKGRERLCEVQNILGDYSKHFFEVQFESVLYRKLVWTAQYRSQLLHHCATVSNAKALFVVASLTSIVYVCFVKFEESLLEKYRKFLKRISATYLNPLYTNDQESNLGLQPNEFAHARDSHTFKIWRKFSKAIIDKNNEDVLPPAHDLIPYAVSFWNHTKGGQDVASRILKNVKVDFSHLTPRGFIYIRLIMTSLMNAHLLMRLLNIESSLNRFETYHSLKKAIRNQGSFEDFLRLFVQEWEPSLTVLSIFTSELSALPTGSQTMIVANENISQDQQDYHVPKRNRLNFFNKVIGRQRRLNCNVNHRSTSTSSRHCVVCSNRTTCFCVYCEASLCKTKPQTGTRTCWERFHENFTLRFILRESGTTRGRKRRNP